MEPGSGTSGSRTSGISWPVPRRTTLDSVRQAELCDAASRATWTNLTLATPTLNRNQKGAKDAAEWVPQQNRCWFAARIVAVRHEYNLTVDRREAAALEGILKDCRDEEMETPRATD